MQSDPSIYLATYARLNEGGFTLWFLCDGKKLDVANEVALGLDSWRVVSVCEITWNPEAARFPNLHEWNTFPVCWDATSKVELSRLVLEKGGINQFSFLCPLGKVHNNKIIVVSLF